MTEEEKDYLNRFYGEYVNASFSGDILMETPEENIDKMAELEAERDFLEEELGRLDPVKDMEERNPIARRFADIKDEIRDLDYTRDAYNRNNMRNRCIHNKGKATNNVELRSWKEFDQNNIYDREYHDLELLNAYNAGLLEDDEED